MKRKLTITFILPFVNLTGGVKILFEHANRLAKKGHKVTIIYPGKLFHGTNFEIENNSWLWLYVEAPTRQVKYWFFVSLLHKTDANWFHFDSQAKLIRTPDLTAKYIPDSDVVIATAPETVKWVSTYPISKGTKVHFAQDYETWYLPREFVDATLAKFNKEMRLITIGKWQKELYEQLGHPVDTIIPDGVDTKSFVPNRSGVKADKLSRILMNYHQAPYKGMIDGFKAIEIVKSKGHNIQAVLFGLHPLGSEVPADVEYHQNIAQASLPELYRSCDIFLWPTHREGFGLPPLEAMACGLPVVGTDTGAMSDYMINGSTGYIVPIKKPASLAKRLEKLVSDKNLRQKMGHAAHQGAQRWDWGKQTTKLEKYLLKLINNV